MFRDRSGVGRELAEMTILEVTAVPFAPEFPGGGERYPSILSAELGRSERVVVSFADHDSERTDGGQRLLLPALHLRAPPFLTQANPLPRWATFSAIRRYIMQHRSEIEFVHVHNPRTALGATWVWIAMLQRSGSNFKIIITDHAARFAPFPRLAASAADYYVAVSQHSLAQLNELATRPGIVLPPPVPEVFLQGPPLRPFSSRDIDLLYLGRVVPWKRPDKFLELARRVEAARPRPLRVTLAGAPLEDGYWADLRRRANDLGLRISVEFVRRPSDATVLDLYGRAKFFVLLSMHTDEAGRFYRNPELAPASVVEAAARGTPSVVSNLRGVDEQVIPGVTGFVVDPEDLDSVAGRVAGLLDDPTEWAKLSAAAREFAVRERSPRAFGEKMVGFLQNVREGRL
jgi:glycosyltransferase involved in cell wall biosynthesis